MPYLFLAAPRIYMSDVELDPINNELDLLLPFWMTCMLF